MKHFSRSELMDFWLISEQQVVLLKKWHEYFGDMEALRHCHRFDTRHFPFLNPAASTSAMCRGWHSERCSS